MFILSTRVDLICILIVADFHSTIYAALTPQGTGFVSTYSIEWGHFVPPVLWGGGYQGVYQVITQAVYPISLNFLKPS